MAKAGQRKCMSCGEFFTPDHRKGERQRYCCAAQCRRASKAASQAAAVQARQRWVLQQPRARRADAGLARRASGPPRVRIVVVSIDQPRGRR